MKISDKRKKILFPIIFAIGIGIVISFLTVYYFDSKKVLFHIIFIGTIYNIILFFLRILFGILGALFHKSFKSLQQTNKKVLKALFILYLIIIFLISILLSIFLIERINF